MIIAARMVVLFLITFFLFEAAPHAVGNLVLAASLPAYAYTTFYLSRRSGSRPRKGN